MTYEIYESPTGSKVITKLNEDGSTSFIPMDESNSDYQAYLESLKEGK